MIPIERIRAPRAIETERARRLPDAMSRFGDGAQQPRRDDLTGYDVARRPRWIHQHGKCAYCDRDVALTGHPTEHFRPVLGGYWWLAWSWENLLFACVSCNGPKSCAFPLRPGSKQLSLGMSPPGHERPILVNPYDEDPTSLISFEQDQDGRWLPIGIGSGKERGEEIIRILALKQHEAAYGDWVDKVLTPDLDHICSLAPEDVPPPNADLTSLQDAWDRFLVGRYDETQKFRLLTWCVVNARLPEPKRRAWGLPMEPPRTRARPPGTAALEEANLLDSLPDPTRDLVYRLGERASNTDWDKALLAVLARGSTSLHDLAILSGSEERTVWQHLKRLGPAKVTLEGKGASRSARLT